MDARKIACLLATIACLALPAGDGFADDSWGRDAVTSFKGRTLDELGLVAVRIADKIFVATLSGLYGQAQADSEPLPEKLVAAIEPGWTDLTDRPLHLDARILVSPELMDILSSRFLGGHKLGIVFYDVIVLREPLEETALCAGYLAHELIHVAQFRETGFDRFLIEYTRQWAENGADYSKNPLEEEAFRVQEGIAARLGDGRVGSSNR